MAVQFFLRRNKVHDVNTRCEPGHEIFCQRIGEIINILMK